VRDAIRNFGSRGPWGTNRMGRQSAPVSLAVGRTLKFFPKTRTPVRPGHWELNPSDLEEEFWRPRALPGPVSVAANSASALQNERRFG